MWDTDVLCEKHMLGARVQQSLVKCIVYKVSVYKWQCCCDWTVQSALCIDVLHRVTVCVCVCVVSAVCNWVNTWGGCIILRGTHQNWKPPDGAAFAAENWNPSLSFVSGAISATSSSSYKHAENRNTQITIAPSVDKGWIVIWIYIGNVVDPCQY